MEHHNWHVIVNPIAGKGICVDTMNRILNVLYDALDLPMENVYKTSSKGHAIELTKKAIRLGARNIISIGGDGTNHEVINGILSQSDVASDEISHAHFPAGSGNDWVKTINIPIDIYDWVKMVQQKNTRLHNAGKITYYENKQLQTRYFINVAGMAYDAFVVKYLENKKVIKKSGSIYLMMILKCLFKYKKQKAKVVIDGVEYSNRFYTINIGLCKYSGGGMSLVPHADPFGDKFAVTLAGNISRLGVILNTWRFYNESILKHKKINGYLADFVQVESWNNHPISIEADGEYLGESPVSISLMPKVLKIVVP